MNTQEMNTQTHGQSGGSHGSGTQGTMHQSPGGATSQPKSSGVQQQGSTSMRQGNGVDKQQHQEGMVAKTIEKQTAKLPSDLFLWAALGAMGTSAVMQFTGHKDKSRFFGQWVAPFLLFGVYNKLVKTQGSDRTERGH